MDPLLRTLASSTPSSTGGDAARRQLYLDIISKGLAGDEENPTFSAFECHKAAILPVLVKDCRESCHDIQLSALELVGHLVAMASSFEAPAFQPSQASSLWGAVAKVLGDEDSKRMSKVLALFAISTNTMEPRLVAPSVAQLAPGVARSMRDESTVVRQQSAAAIHSLLGTAPDALARCDPGATEDPEEDTDWVRCLLRLCFDDAVVVRAGALSAAERAVSMGHLRGNAGVAAWVLKALRDGSLSESMKRVLFHNAGSRSPAAPNAAGVLAEGGNASGISPASAAVETPPRQATPQRVKQTIRAWAVYLSLADMASLLQTRSDGQKKLMDDGTSLLSWLSGKFADSRESVRVQAVEAWEMFTVNMVAQMSRSNAGSRSGYDQVRKVAQMFLTSFHRLALRDRNAVVREAAMTSLSRLVASCPSRLFKPFWAPTPKASKKGSGVAEMLQQLAGARNGEVAQHQCARLLAALLPCFLQGPLVVPGRVSPTHASGTEPHPSLQSAGVNLADEVTRLLSTLETLMKAFRAPVPEDAASAIDAVTPPPPPPSPNPSTCGRESVEDSAIRLEALPTTGLIVSAWCGLAFWAMDQAVAAAAVATGCAAATNDSADDGVAGGTASVAAPVGQDSPSGSIAGGKGKGKGRPAANRPVAVAATVAPTDGAAAAAGHQQARSDPSTSSVTPRNAKEGVEGAATSQPLLILLGWLLGPGTEEDRTEIPGVTTKNGETRSTGSCSGVSEAPGESAVPGAAHTVAMVSSTGNLVRWKVALLGALIRGLSRRMTLSRGKATPRKSGSGIRPPEEGWLDAPVDTSALYPETTCTSAAGGDAVCNECSLAGTVVREAVSKDRGVDKVPLNLVLLGGVLRRRCESTNRCTGRDTDTRGGGSGDNVVLGGGSSRGDVGGDDGGGHGTFVGGSSPHGKGGTASNNSCRSPCVLSCAFLTEALALLPRGASARLLKSLFSGVLSAKRGGQEEEDSALVLLGRVWRAEAGRILTAWGCCRPLSSSESGSTTGVVFDGKVQGPLSGEKVYRKTSATLREGPRGIGQSAKVRDHELNEHESSERLRSDTAFVLRFLLQTASSLFSRPPTEGTWARSHAGDGAGASAPVGDACDPTNNDAVRHTGQGELREATEEVANDNNLEVGRARRCWSPYSKRRLTAINSVFGADSATLWRKLIEARRRSQIEPEGVSRLLKAIAKDCARCALSSPRTGVTAPSSGGGKDGGLKRSQEGPPPSELEDKLNVDWELEFSQTQSQQHRSSQRDGRDKGAGRARGMLGAAPTTQEHNPAAPAARNVRFKGDTGLVQKREEQKRRGGDQIALPPPFSSLPVLTAATLTLLTAAPKEPDAKLRVWKAGLATLAWTLTAAPPDTTQPLAQLSPQLQPSTLNLPDTAAVVTPLSAEEETAIAVEVCRCLAAVRSALAAVVSATATSVFALDGGSLAPVCRLLAVALSRSHAAAASVSPAAAAARGKPLLHTTVSVSAAADTKRALVEAVVAAIPSVLYEARALVVDVLSAVKKVVPSPALLWALTPMLQAVLDLPASSDADSLQSSFLDVWNATFGNANVTLQRPPSSSGARDRGKPGRTEPVVSWEDAFSASLLCRLSALSQRAEVTMPVGIALPTLNDSAVVVSAGRAVEERRRGSGFSEDPSHQQKTPDQQMEPHQRKELAKGVVSGNDDGGAKEKRGKEASGQAAAAAAAIGVSRGAAVGRGFVTPAAAAAAAAIRSGGVAGALPVEGAKRSFIRQASTGPTPDRGALATPKKRSPSPTSRTDGTGSATGGPMGKFVRIVGSGQGSSNKTPAKRAAVTTHTSLDASQSMAPWEDGSQLPDTEPDSVPDLPLEENKLPPPPPKDVLSSPTRSPPKPPSTPISPAIHSTASSDAAISPGKRSVEEAEFETVHPDKMAPSSAAAATACGVVGVILPDTASERRVRPRTEPCTSSHDSGTATTADASVTPAIVSKSDAEGESAGGTSAAAASTAAAPAGKSAASENESAKRLEATMAAISKASNSSSSNSSGGEAKGDDDDDDEDDDGDDEDDSHNDNGIDRQSEMSGVTSSVRRASSDQYPGAGGGGGGGCNVGVNELLQDFRSLTSRLEAARPAMSPEQFEEVGALVQKIVER